MEQKLNTLKTTRKIASETLFLALRDLLSKDKPISEIDLRDRWLEELRKHKAIYPDGWYITPAFGTVVIFATDKDGNKSRLNYESFRKVCLRNDIFLDRKRGLVYVYASPVDRKTGIIGDFGITIYFGSNKAIIKNLKRTLKLNQSIFSSVKVRSSFSNIFSNATVLMKNMGFVNKATSVTNAGKANIGHSVPFLNNKEWKNIKSKSWEEIKDFLSLKRVFVNSQEQTLLMPGMVITIEPEVRVKKHPQIPILSYHTIGLFGEDGNKKLLTNFEEIFNLAKMDYMLK